MRAPVRHVLVVLATLAAIALAWQLRAVLLTFVLSLAVAATFRPTIAGLMRRGLPLPVALVLAYGAALLVGGALLGLAAGPIVGEAQGVFRGATDLYDRLHAEWPEGTTLQRTLVQLLPPSVVLYDALEAQASSIAATLLGVATGVIDVLIEIGIVLILSIYWSLDQGHFERLWLALLPIRTRIRARHLWRRLEGRVGAVIRMQVVLSALAGVLLAVGYVVLGLERPVALAFAGALFRLIPWLGPVLAVGAPFFSNPGDMPRAIVGALYTTGVLLALDRYVRSWLLGGERSSGLLGLLTLIVMGRAAGIVGLIIAPAVAAAIGAILDHLQQPTPAVGPEGLAHVEALRARLDAVRASLAAAPQGPSPQLASLVERLDGLLDQANECCTP
ncbi:MAG TPA: AI-2E family transporter [Chloroflexi bacterium]|jgi:predicted PurR-regulated permease PerM|nr:AI-2E family transporter [Chloroflexota bacterium]